MDRQEDIPKKFEQLLGTLKIPLARDDTMTYVQLLQGMQQYCSLGALASPSQAEQASGDENKDGYIAVYTTSSSSGTVSASKTYYKYNISALSEGDCVSYAAKLRESSKTVTDAIVALFTKQSTAFEKDSNT